VLSVEEYINFKKVAVPSDCVESMKGSELQLFFELQHMRSCMYTTYAKYKIRSSQIESTLSYSANSDSCNVFTFSSETYVDTVDTMYILHIEKHVRCISLSS